MLELKLYEQKVDGGYDWETSCGALLDYHIHGCIIETMNDGV